VDCGDQLRDIAEKETVRSMMGRCGLWGRCTTGHGWSWSVGQSSVPASFRTASILHVGTLHLGSEGTG
jgi:hypothetical protein